MFPPGVFHGKFDSVHLRHGACATIYVNSSSKTDLRSSVAAGGLQWGGKVAPVAHIHPIPTHSHRRTRTSTPPPTHLRHTQRRARNIRPNREPSGSSPCTKAIGKEVNWGSTCRARNGCSGNRHLPPQLPANPHPLQPVLHMQDRWTGCSRASILPALIPWAIYEKLPDAESTHTVRPRQNREGEK